MKHMVLHPPAGLDALRLQHCAIPEPGPGQVRVRWHASSLNFHDFCVVTGVLPVASPRVPLSDGAGVVDAVGPGVDDWKVGDRVLSLFFPKWHEGPPRVSHVRQMTGDTIDGCAAQYSVVDAAALTPMPSGWSFAEAATLPCAALTSWRALMSVCRVKPGDRVLVEGTGGMALAALQIAKMAGAEVYATSSSDVKLERLRAIGADHVINYREDPEWGATVARLSGGGVEHVLDSGGRATLAQSIRAAAVGGNVVVIGVLGGVDVQLDLLALIGAQVRLQAIAVGHRREQIEMVRAFERSGVRPVLDRSFALEALAHAFRYQASGRHVGKIIVEIE
ncbi:zinc-dependent alcohol dehydrogenase family protein [Sinimarinibacterium thermocellulolyticum]|uniref:NAD(P)-dependent alcohol dehydrogenase n=1 Tax=Sinimarinibacterium thermocellulolyticum TaxID=3170016 RepID=A0ABV2ADV7_9GAMM